ASRRTGAVRTSDVLDAAIFERRRRQSRRSFVKGGVSNARSNLVLDLGQGESRPAYRGTTSARNQRLIRIAELWASAWRPGRRTTGSVPARRGGKEERPHVNDGRRLRVGPRRPRLWRKGIQGRRSALQGERDIYG